MQQVIRIRGMRGYVPLLSPTVFRLNRRNYEAFGLEKRTQHTSISNDSSVHIDSNSIYNFHIENQYKMANRARRKTTLVRLIPLGALTYKKWPKCTVCAYVK